MTYIPVVSKYLLLYIVIQGKTAVLPVCVGGRQDAPSHRGVHRSCTRCYRARIATSLTSAGREDRWGKKNSHVSFRIVHCNADLCNFGKDNKQGEKKYEEVEHVPCRHAYLWKMTI